MSDLIEASRAAMPTNNNAGPERWSSGTKGDVVASLLVP